MVRDRPAADHSSAAALVLAAGRAARRPLRRAASTPLVHRRSSRVAALVDGLLLWNDVSDDGPKSRLIAGMLALDGFSLFVTIVIVHRG